jgi:microcystin-dependent protein
MSDLRGHTDPSAQYADRIAGYDQRLQMLERSHRHEPQTPVGAMVAWPAPALPNLWAYCDGSPYSASQYPDLFAAIGYTWGGSAGTFNLPDLRSRTVVGAGQGSGLSNRALAAAGGAETVALTAAQTGSHNHVVAATTGNESANHGHTGTSSVESAGHTHTGTTGNEAQAHTHGVPGQGTGVAAGGTTIYPLAAAAPAAEQTAGASNAHTHTFTSAAASNQHQHTTPVGAEDSPHAHSFNTTSDAGGTLGNAHDNMAPFRACFWIIKVLPSTAAGQSP